jgi:cell wall-associated NlpC family hydrolase
MKRALILAALFVSCGTAPQTTVVVPPAAPPAADSSGKVTRQAILDYAKTGIGSHYVWGGTQWNPDDKDWKGPDCSGYVGKAWMLPARVDPTEEPAERWTTLEFHDDRDLWSDVPKKNMLPADALVYRASGSGHIVLFNGETDNGSYKTMEAKGTAYGVINGVRTQSSMSAFIGIKRDGVTGDKGDSI